MATGALSGGDKQLSCKSAARPAQGRRRGDGGTCELGGAQLHAGRTHTPGADGGRAGPSWPCVCMDVALGVSGWVAVVRVVCTGPRIAAEQGWGDCSLAIAQEEERAALVIG